MKHFKIVLMAIIIGNFAFSCVKKSEKARVSYVSGAVVLVRGQSKSQLNHGQELLEKDIIKTGSTGIAIVTMQNENAYLEIQPESEIILSDILQKQKTIQVNSGNLWFKLKKNNENDFWQVTTPTSTAGVRGTTFYTFQIEDMFGTCHCDGDVSYSAKGYTATHHKDYLTVSSRKKTILLKAEDFAKQNIKPNHHHSILDDSPVGPKVDMSQKELSRFMKLLREKLKD